MMKLLLAVDGSDNAVRATRRLVELASALKEQPQVELVTVRAPLPYLGGFASAVVNHDMVQRYYDDEGGQALAPSAEVLDAAGLRYVSHVLVGDIPETIAGRAHESGCALICMGSRGMSAISNLVLGSVATKVLHLADVPVMLVR